MRWRHRLSRVRRYVLVVVVAAAEGDEAARDGGSCDLSGAGGSAMCTRARARASVMSMVVKSRLINMHQNCGVTGRSHDDFG